MNRGRDVVWNWRSSWGLEVLERYRTIMKLHLSQTNSTQNLLRLSLCRWEIKFFRVRMKTFRMGDPTSSKVALCKDRQGIGKLNGTLGQFERLSHVWAITKATSNQRTLVWLPLRRNISQRAFAAAALFWFALNAVSKSFVPEMKACVRSASGRWAFLLTLTASRPRSNCAAHPEGFYYNLQQ